MEAIALGKFYKVVSQRKGTFCGIVSHISGEWITLKITKGKAKAICHYNERLIGEEVTVRNSLTTFSEIAGDSK